MPAFVQKKHKRFEPGKEPTEVHVVYNNVSMFSHYRPDPKKPADENKTVFVMNCGVVMVCDVAVKTVAATFESMK